MASSKKKKFSEQSVSEEGGSGACGDEHCLVGGRRLRTGGKPGFVGGGDCHQGGVPRGRSAVPGAGGRAASFPSLRAVNSRVYPTQACDRPGGRDAADGWSYGLKFPARAFPRGPWLRQMQDWI